MTLTSTTTSPSECLEHDVPSLIRRYDQLSIVLARLEDDLEGAADLRRCSVYQAALDEQTRLQDRIVATPATTSAALQAKLEFIRNTGYVADQHGGGDASDLQSLVEMILEMDATRIAAPIPEIAEITADCFKFQGDTIHVAMDTTDKNRIEFKISVGQMLLLFSAATEFANLNLAKTLSLVG